MEENIFDKIRHTDENSSEYWMARELATGGGMHIYIRVCG